jgi:transposase-like protein
MNDASFRELLIRHKESGLTIRDFCFNEGISESIYYYWLKKHRNEADKPKEFIPLLVGNHLPAQRKNQLLQSNTTSQEMHLQDENQMEFVFPNGTRLMIRNQVDPAILQTIVHLYD